MKTNLLLVSRIESGTRQKLCNAFGHRLNVGGRLAFSHVLAADATDHPSDTQQSDR